MNATASMHTLHLYQFPISHYCEKVRWALDFKGLSYHTDNLMPLFHIPMMLRMSRQTQVPVLRYGKTVVAGSDHIIDYLETAPLPGPSLYPEVVEARQEALALAADWDRNLGPHVRRAAYFHVLDQRDYAGTLLTLGQGWTGRSAFRVCQPLVIRAMIASMKIDETGYRRSLSRLEEVLDRLETRIRPGQPLVGDRFSVADLTAASLLAPLCNPPQHPWPQPDGAPRSFLAFQQRFEGRPAMDWALAMYRQYRSPQQDQ